MRNSFDQAQVSRSEREQNRTSPIPPRFVCRVVCTLARAGRAVCGLYKAQSRRSGWMPRRCMKAVLMMTDRLNCGEYLEWSAERTPLRLAQRRAYLPYPNSYSALVCCIPTGDIWILPERLLISHSPVCLQIGDAVQKASNQAKIVNNSFAKY